MLSASSKEAGQTLKMPANNSFGSGLDMFSARTRLILSPLWLYLSRKACGHASVTGVLYLKLWTGNTDKDIVITGNILILW